MPELKEKKMANRKSCLGILVIALVFGMMVVGCGDDSDSGGNPLIGRWYSTQEAAESDRDTDVAFEFTSNGKLLTAGTDQGITYTVSKNTLTTKASGGTMGTTKFSISGNVLTLDNYCPPISGILTYYKAGSSGSGSGGGQGQSLNAAINILRGWGYTGTFYTPNQGTFDKYYTWSNYGANYLTIIFKNSSINDYNAYKNKWLEYIISSDQEGPFYDFSLELTDGISADVTFSTSSYSIDGNPPITVQPKSIVFMAYDF